MRLFGWLRSGPDKVADIVKIAVVREPRNEMTPPRSEAAMPVLAPTAPLARKNITPPKYYKRTSATPRKIRPGYCRHNWPEESCSTCELISQLSNPSLPSSLHAHVAINGKSYQLPPDDHDGANERLFYGRAGWGQLS